MIEKALFGVDEKFEGEFMCLYFVKLTGNTQSLTKKSTLIFIHEKWYVNSMRILH